MNQPQNINPNSSDIPGNPAGTNEITEALREEMRVARKEALQEKQKRQQLQDNLRKSTSIAQSVLDNREKQEKETIRLIRSGLSSEIEQAVTQIKNELSRLKNKGDLSKKSEQDFLLFQKIITAFIDKKKNLEQMESNLDHLRKKIKSPEATPNDESALHQILETTRLMNLELRKFSEKLLQMYEQLEDQIQNDYREEEIFHEAFATCLDFLNENQQREITARFEIKYKNGPLEAKIAFYKSIIESLVKGHPLIALKFHSLFRKNAKECIKRKNYDRAVSELCYALQISKDNGKSWRLLASAFMAKGAKADALTALHEALRLDPGDMELHKTLAAESFKANSINEAIQEYENIIRRCPEDTESCCALAKIYYHQSNYSKVIEFITNTIPESQRDIEIQRILALSYIYNHNYKEAIPILALLAQTNPNNEDILKHLAICYRKNGNHQTAIVLLKKYFQDKTKPSSALLILLAATYVEIGEMAKAEELYTQVITNQPSLTRSLYLPLAYVQSQQGKIIEAIQSYSKLVPDNPANPHVILPLCDLLRRKGKTESAKKILESAVQHEPTNAEFKQELAMIYIETGEWEKSTELLQKK